LFFDPHGTLRSVALLFASATSGVEGHPALTDEEPILHMWEQFSDLGEYENSVIDNSDLDAEQTALLIWNKISAAPPP
jgi:hypothetical protein